MMKITRESSREHYFKNWNYLLMFNSRGWIYPCACKDDYIMYEGVGYRLNKKLGRYIKMNKNDYIMMLSLSNSTP